MTNLKDFTKTAYPYIYKHKTNGTYGAFFKLYDKVYNKRVNKKKIGFKTIKEAQFYIAEEKVKFEKEQSHSKLPKNILFKDVFASYIKECEIEERKGNLAESTVDGKREIFKNQILPKLGNVKIADIREEHIYKFHNDLLTMTCSREKDKNLSNQTLIKVHKQLSAFLNWCVRKRLITYNPAGIVGNFKKVKKEKEFLTYQEFMTLLSVVDNIRDLFIIQLLFYTGLRVSELLGLSVDSIITTEQGTALNITETYYKGKIRPKAKTDEAMDDLFLDDITVEAYHTFLEYRKANNITSRYLFANNRGKSEVIGDKAIRDMIKKYLKLAGIEKNITPHKLRHSHAALLIYMGKTLEDIKTRLRHKDIRTTSNEYGHMYKERKILLANDLTEFRTENTKNINIGSPSGSPDNKIAQKKD